VDHSLSILLTGSITTDVHFFVYTLRSEITMLSRTETQVKSYSYIHLSYQWISVLDHTNNRNQTLNSYTCTIILIMPSCFRLGLPSSIYPGSGTKVMSFVHVLHSLSINSFIYSPSQYLLEYKLWIFLIKKFIQSVLPSLQVQIFFSNILYLDSCLDGIGYRQVQNKRHIYNVCVLVLGYESYGRTKDEIMAWMDSPNPISVHLNMLIDVPTS
jgi:hypothetical protein